ncbi:unnamed protein product [Pieris macdunnoughi]|uniref:Immunoglobulin domain-containing protein n=1 Tax=Pieris macdunnoughi TaxID=345717 RepID=A0A821RUH3_9NEOP|nr:unnamed protein product [Pieris macdunnoughi]
MMLVNSQATDVDVKLVAPSWVARGGSAKLRCLHQVPPQLLYKVEFLRSGAKILQYVRERVPPYTNYTFQGGKVNMSLVTENSITLENLDPTASGLYWCEVSLETPIFTAASPPHQLTVVYSQKHPPIITFGKPDVVVGGLLRANCTSAPAAPAPKLIWYIDNEKVPEDSIKYFSYRVSSSTRTKGGGEPTPEVPASIHSTGVQLHGKILGDGHEEVAKIEKPRELAPPPISLWVSIAELRTPAHGRLQLTCTATIPEEVGPGERFADIKKQTVTVAVNELTLKKPQSDTSVANGTATTLHNFTPIWLIGYSFLIQELRITLV